MDEESDEKKMTIEIKEDVEVMRKTQEFITDKSHLPIMQKSSYTDSLPSISPKYKKKELSSYSRA